MLTLFNWLFNGLIAVIVFLLGASLFHNYAGTPPWIAGILLFIIGLALYIGNILLIRYYITKRAPKFANDEMWEMTAGKSIVPKWVSFLGLLAFPAFVATIIWFVKWYWGD